MLNKQELMERLNISLSTVNKLMRQGMPHIKVGSAVRFDYEEVIHWLKERNK